MSSVPADTAPPPPRPSPWFRSAPFDLVLILGVPFLTWPLITLAKDAWGPALLSQLILLTATGHYVATFVRAYGDLELFARFRVRFVVAPVVLLATCVGMYVGGYGPQLMIMVAAWAFWHWLAQAFGFARIYDIKVGSFHPLTALLDKALVIVGFVATVTLNDGAVATFGKLFLDAGITLPSAAAMATVQTVVGTLCIVVGAAYVANLGATIARGRPWSWQKQFMHVTTIGYYWFAFSWLPNVLIAHVLYEFFHDIQYFAITWITCRHRVTRPGVARWLGWMFRPTWIAAAIFVVLMTSVGALDAFGRRELHEDPTGYNVWIGVFLAMALLHYYYDGFIWKARERTLGGDLGLAGGMRAAVVPTVRHGAAWSLFFLPLVGVVLLGRQDGFSERERAEALVAVAPGDFHSRAVLGMQLTRARELEPALENYRASVALNGDYAPSRVNYGAALDLNGDLDEAIAQYRAALACVDQDGAHAQANVNLGVLLLLRGDRDDAVAHFRAGRDLGGQNPIERLLAMAAAMPQEARQRRADYYAAVLALDPKVLQARMQLGLVLLELNRPHDATPHLQYCVQTTPDYVPALTALARAQLGTGDRDAAQSTLRRALRLAPGNGELLRLQARAEGR